MKASALIWLSVGLLIGMQFLHSISNHLVYTSVGACTYNVQIVHVLQVLVSTSVLHAIVGSPFFSFYIPINYFKKLWLQPVLRKRIHVFLGLPDPDPDPSIIKQNSEKTLDFYCFVTSF